MKPLTGPSLVCRVLAVLALAVLAGCDARPSPETSVRNAEAALADGHYAQAMAELRGVLAADPEHRGARIALARFFLIAGDTEQALANLNRAAKPANQDATLRELRYEILLAGRQYAEVLKQIESERTLDGARRLTLLAMAQSGSGRFEEAEHSLAEAFALAPADSRILLERARNKVAEGQIGPATERLAPLLERKPPVAGAWLLRGNIAMLQANFRAARDAFTKAYEARLGALRVPEQVAALTGVVEANLSLPDVPGAQQAIASLAAAFPSAPILHYLRGRLALARNDPKSAVTELRIATQAAPDSPEPRRLLAMALAGTGSLDAARSELLTLLEKYPNHFTARKQLSQLELWRGDPAAARHWLESAPAGSPTDSQSDWLLGSAFLRSGDTAGGLAYLERSVAADPANENARLALAVQYLSNGQREKAIAVLEALPVSAGHGRRQALLLLARIYGLKPEQARQETERLMQTYPEDAALLSAAGSYFLAGGDHQRAVDLMRRAVTLSNDPQYRLALAEAQARSGDTAGAQKILQEVLSADPRYQGAYLGLARLALDRGDRDAGRTWLEKAIAADPSAVEARLNLAQLAFAQGDAPRAKGLLDQVVTVGGQRPEILLPVGRLLIQGEQYDAVIEKLGTAESVARLPDAQFILGQAYLALNRRPEAQRAFENALAANPRWSRDVKAAALNNLAWLYFESGDARALEVATKAYDIGSGILEVADTYGWILVEKNRTAQGLPILEKAVTARGGKVDPQITYHLAAAYARSGARDQSRTILQPLLESQQAFASRRDAEELLKSLKGK